MERSDKLPHMSSQCVPCSVVANPFIDQSVLCSMLSIPLVVCITKRVNWNNGGRMLPASVIMSSRNVSSINTPVGPNLCFMVCCKINILSI